MVNETIIKETLVLRGIGLTRHWSYEALVKLALVQRGNGQRGIGPTRHWSNEALVKEALVNEALVYKAY